MAVDFEFGVAPSSGFGTVQIIGYRELMSAFRMLYPELYKELNAGLRAIVKEAETSAIIFATLQGFAPPGRSGRGTGALIGQIRSGVTHTKGYLADAANRDGYYYPARYEYENGGARRFLRPAIDENHDKIYASIAAVVGQAMKAFDAP